MTPKTFKNQTALQWAIDKKIGTKDSKNTKGVPLDVSIGRFLDALGR